MWGFENQFLLFHKGTFRERVVVKNDVTLQAAILMQKAPNFWKLQAFTEVHLCCGPLELKGHFVFDAVTA